MIILRRQNSLNKIYIAVSFSILSFTGCYEQEQTEGKERHESVIIQTGSDTVRSVSPSDKTGLLPRQTQEILNTKSSQDGKYKIGEPRDANDLKSTAGRDPQQPAIVIGDPLDASNISDMQMDLSDKEEIIIGVPLDASNLEPGRITGQNNDVVIIGDHLDASNLNNGQLNLINGPEIIIGEPLDANMPYVKHKK
jgi:hypothetical protein